MTARIARDPIVTRASSNRLLGIEPRTVRLNRSRRPRGRSCPGTPPLPRARGHRQGTSTHEDMTSADPAMEPEPAPRDLILSLERRPKDEVHFRTGRRSRVSARSLRARRGHATPGTRRRFYASRASARCGLRRFAREAGYELCSLIETFPSIPNVSSFCCAARPLTRHNSYLTNRADYP